VLIVSEPARAAQESRGAIGVGMTASLRLNDGAAYVSAEPGAVADASTVDIENLRLHEITPVQLVAGGFDPVTIPAVVGDSIEFRFKLTGGGITTVRTAVPARRRPRVVRTHPARGRRDVAINSIVTTVFSEPINPTTLRDSTVRLLRDGVAVRGTIRPTSGPVPGVEFVPAEPLLPATTYRLVFDGRIADLSGDALEVPEPVEFVTFGEGGTGALTVITTTRGTDQPDGYAILVDGRFAENIGVSDTVVITGLGAGEHHVLLSAMSEYCYATGGLYRQARLTPTVDALVEFNVVCTDLPELELRVTTTGVEQDPDGYRVVVNRLWDAHVPSGGTLPLREVRYGVNVVSLSDVRHNCRDPLGLQRVVDLSAGQSGSVSFALRCTPDFTPPGRIAFASYRSEGSSAIVIADADGANRLQITDGSAPDRLPAWSPDGSRLAFIRGDEWDVSRVFLVNADGSGLRERMLNFYPETIVSLAWISRGQELALSTATGLIHIIRADGDIDGLEDPVVRRLAVGGTSYGCCAWSPVEPRVAYIWGSSMRVADGGGTFLREFRPTPSALWSHPVWSPDGRRIAVVACRDPVEGECTRLGLEIMPATGSGSTLVPLPESIQRPAWSPDGSTFAYIGCSGCPGIRYLRTDGTGTSVSISDGFDPAWKP
jgi:hypothetical protein